MRNRGELRNAGTYACALRRADSTLYYLSVSLTFSFFVCSKKFGKRGCSRFKVSCNRLAQRLYCNITLGWDNGGTRMFIFFLHCKGITTVCTYSDSTPAVTAYVSKHSLMIR